MSSAVQTAPHQTPNISSLGGTSQQSPSTASPSGRPYSSQQSREQYYNSQPTSNSASPNSAATRKPSRSTGNGAPSNNSQQPQYYSPTGSSQNTAPIKSRMANAVSSTSATASPTNNPQSRGSAPVAPPRTSSYQKSSGLATSAAVSAATRTTKADEIQSSSPRMAAAGDGQEYDTGNGRAGGGERERSREDAVAAAANATSRSRRRPEQEQLPYRSNSGQNTQNPQSRSRQANSTATPSGPTREPSEVINRVVVSSADGDVERERARLAEAASAGGNDALMANPETKEDQPRRRQDHKRDREKTSKFGDYFLGNTLGEGEFGKVKMGWKITGGPDVAIKLIRKESVGSNPTRLAKIYREIAILREISHPNIVRLHEKVETERHIGIILEYASGGELFDYILQHRYLKDNHARRLFAQLISGVGYLHKKGIVHRDLKLENLLLDRNRNIIITDFGFANTFNATDELGDEIEYNLGSRDYVKRMELDKILNDGHRRGDLMQTSCGSPCYAAPELVVSDSLYTGRKVDVWSCGVILYAMLAGYLPFDDDPANPEGDNINLLYKYIVSTPLTFPEYVTPHARDLLRRILVPDPRKRADLFEVARHSWLSEFSHVVGFITSSTTTTGDIANTTVGSEDQEVPLLNRSASVRESSKTQKPTSAVGELGRKHGNVDQDDAELHSKPHKDNKRRTVQVEYVPPRSETVRGAPPLSSNNVAPRSRGRSGSSGASETTITRKPVGAEKQLSQASAVDTTRRPSSSQNPQGMAPPARQGRTVSNSASQAGYTSQTTGSSVVRPPTGNSMASTTSLGLVTRGSYGQPLAPTVAGTNVQGRMSQPNSQPNQAKAQPRQPQGDLNTGRPTVPDKFRKVSGFAEGVRPESAAATTKSSHKRSSTVTSIDKFFGRASSIFGGGRKDTHERSQEKRYPPVSMAGKMPNDNGENPRRSMESRRSSFGFGKKRSGSMTGSSDGKSRRMSILPASWSFKSIGIGKDSAPGTPGTPSYDDQFEDQQPRGNAHQNRSSTAPNVNLSNGGDAGYDSSRDSPVSPVSPIQENKRGPQSSVPQPRYASQPVSRSAQMSGGNPSQHHTVNQFRQGESALTTESDSSIDHYSQNPDQRRPQYPPGFNETTNRNGVQRGVLQKNHRKFVDAYESKGDDGAYGKVGKSAGSSSAARKVMDFFRRKGNDRTMDG